MPTYPVPTLTPEPDGFSLIEVLVAVVVATLLLSVACSTLVVSLKSEAVSEHIVGLRAPLSIMRTHALLGFDLEETAQALLPNWTVARYHTGSFANEASPWEFWQISDSRVPSMRVVFSLAKPVTD